MKRILVVDDEPDIQVALQELLRRRLQADVHVASSAAEALAALAKDEFDLLVADHRMPGVTGIELIAQARARMPRMPCVLFTAYQDHALERRALAAGAKLVLSKSLLPADFAQRLRQVLGS